MKIVSWNINSINARIELLKNYLEQHNLDVVLLQELKCEEKNFPYEVLEDMGYNIALNCQKSYNGVAILSKFPIENTLTSFAGIDSPEARYIECDISVNKKLFKIASIYVPNGGEMDSDKFNYKLFYLDKLNEYLRSLLTLDLPFLIGGDFNVAPFDIDVYDAKILAHTTCFSLRERQKIHSLLNIGYNDAFRLQNKDLQDFTWWDYRGNAHGYNKGMRIDYFLLNALASDLLEKCYIEHSIRKETKPSDHAPVVCIY